MEEKGSIRSYRELTAWKKAMQLAKLVYTLTRGWPKEELYSLTTQIRRAAVSIPSNIAEGQGRFSTKEFMHFLRVAHGSLTEMETQIILAQDLGYLSNEQTDQLLASSAEVGRLINGLYRSLANK